MRGEIIELLNKMYKLIHSNLQIITHMLKLRILFAFKKFTNG